MTSSFSITRKKTPFQKHREEEEAKKKRAQDETARLYAEFVESFQGDPTPGSKAFVRGGLINSDDKVNDDQGEKAKDGASGPKKGSRYVPSFIPPLLASKGKEFEKNEEEEKSREREKGKPRNIDNFMEELKHEQELRERQNRDRYHWHQDDNFSLSSGFDELPDEFDPSGKLPGSFDDGDPHTTNLYVGNLSPQVDENFLLRTFGRFGPIASVKIMWPRTEEECKRKRNCGFVAFMNRADGQAAKDEMQGVVVHEYELKIGWGKSVALPSQGLPAPPPGQMAIRSKEGATVILSGPSGPLITSVLNQNSELLLTPNVPDIMVVPPEDDHLRYVIDTMAFYVLDGGCAFEQAIMERGRGNLLFNFLFELGSKEHTYYVWRLYSFAQGDTLRRWRTEPFIMITGSGRWIPPPLAKSPDLEKESGATYAAGRSGHVELERTLTYSQRDEFEDMLRSLTLERSQIKEAMGFSLDNADAAAEIVEVLTESLTLKETPIPSKVARLMLVSDVLHNCSAPVENASAYRTKFEATLPDIMESFNDLYCSVTGRITAEALKERVMKVLHVWAEWFLFSNAYVNGLRSTFLRSGNSGVVPFHSLCSDTPEMEKRTGSADLGDARKITQNDAFMIKGAVQELMILPIVELEKRCRNNGLSLVGGREMMVARLLSLEDAKKHGGFEIDDDLNKIQRHSSPDGYSYDRRELNVQAESAALSGWNHYAKDEMGSQGRGSVALSHTRPNPQPDLIVYIKKEKIGPVLPASKWCREDDDSDDERKTSTTDLGLNYSFSGIENIGDGPSNAHEIESANDLCITAQPDCGSSKEHRKKLRHLEGALIEYRESLEESGIKSPEDIERKVASHLKLLESEHGLSALNEDASGIERASLDQKGRRDNSHAMSRKRHRSGSRNGSPIWRLSNRERRGT